MCKSGPPKKVGQWNIGQLASGQRSSSVGMIELPEELILLMLRGLNEPQDMVSCAAVCRTWRRGGKKTAQTRLMWHVRSPT